MIDHISNGLFAIHRYEHTVRIDKLHYGQQTITLTPDEWHDLLELLAVVMASPDFFGKPDE